MRPAPRFFQSLLYSAFAASFWSMPAHAVTILNTGNEGDFSAAYFDYGLAGHFCVRGVDSNLTESMILSFGLYWLIYRKTKSAEATR